MSQSLEAGQPITLPSSKSIADGLMNLRPGDITFAHIQKFVDEVVTVSEEDIASTVAWLFRNARLVVEPSGAVTTAAVALGLGNVDLSKGPVVAVVRGGNVRPEAFAKYVGILTCGDLTFRFSIDYRRARFCARRVSAPAPSSCNS